MCVCMCVGCVWGVCVGGCGCHVLSYGFSPLLMTTESKHIVIYSLLLVS